MPSIVDTSQFNRFCRQIANSPAVGRNAWDVMLYEVGKVLERCVQLTTEDKFDRIKRSVEHKNRTLRFGKKGSGPATIYITKSGAIWFADEPGPGYENIAEGRRAGGKTFHDMTWFFRYGKPRWARYQEFLAQLKNQQINVRQVLGRAGQSWVQAGDALGVHVKAPAYVRNAPGFRGRKHINGVARKRQTADNLFLEIKNFAPILLGTIDGNRILQMSINGRAEKFRRSFRKGVFDDVKEIARQYPALLAA